MSGLTVRWILNSHKQKHSCKKWGGKSIFDQSDSCKWMKMTGNDCKWQGNQACLKTVSMFHLSTLIYFCYFLIFFPLERDFWASPQTSSVPDLWINYVLFKYTADANWRWCWQFLGRVSGKPADGLVSVGWALHPCHESCPGYTFVMSV